jgi:hypothetical protein
MVPQIKLVVIFEWRFDYGVFLLSFVKTLKNPCLDSMEEVNQPESIWNESKLYDKLNVKQLLSQQITAE